MECTLAKHDFSGTAAFCPVVWSLLLFIYGIWGPAFLPFWGTSLGWYACTTQFQLNFPHMNICPITDQDCLHGGAREIKPSGIYFDLVLRKVHVTIWFGSTKSTGIVAVFWRFSVCLHKFDEVAHESLCHNKCISPEGATRLSYYFSLSEHSQRCVFQPWDFSVSVCVCEVCSSLFLYCLQGKHVGIKFKVQGFVFFWHALRTASEDLFCWDQSTISPLETRRTKSLFITFSMICFPDLALQIVSLKKNTLLSCSSISCSTSYAENHSHNIICKFLDCNVQT